MQTKTCNTCNLTLDISKFKKNHAKCKKCYKKHVSCKHDIRKRHCHECSPQNWCKHDILKYSCPECNPKILCKHNIRKNNCPECNPKILCKHDIRKRDCRECSPQNFCEHDTQKGNCPECNPKLLCKHDQHKRSCPECSPQNFCKHNKSKRSCPECNPKILCEHNIRKYDCPECNPKLLCKHDTRKGNCHICSPKNFCIHCKMIQGRKKYVKSLDKKIKCCARCFYNFYPNDKIPRRYKLRQHFFNEKLTKKFGINFFQYDKKIKCGCSGRMPDWFIDCYKYSIIIELDEDQHKSSSCDQKRMMELFTDLGNRPLVMIRINPDKYKIGKEKIEGCFEFDEKNIIKCLRKEFNKRFNLLVKKIKYYTDNEPTKEITIKKLFFDI